MRNRDETALLNTMAALHHAGRPFGLMTNVGPDEISCAKLLAASPTTKIVLRIWPGGGSGIDLGVRDYWLQNVAGYADRKLATYHQPNNELNDWSPSTIAWWRFQLIMADNMGFKLALPTPPTGTPDIGVYQRNDVLDLMRTVRDGDHLWTAHEYEIDGQGDWTLYRFLHHVYPTLPPDLRNNMPQVGFSEFGIQKMRDMPNDLWLSKVRGYQAELSKYDFVVGAALWSFGDSGQVTNPGENWEMDNFSNHLAQFMEV